MEIYNPTYNSETNKIVAYLLPEPETLTLACCCGDYNPISGENNTKCFAHYEYENSRIEIEVDNELRDFLNIQYIGLDINNIMDMIDVSKPECDGSCYGECVNEYTAKLKQVDKATESKMDKEIEKYSNKIHDLCLHGVLYPKNIVVTSISALITECLDQQTKHLTEQLKQKSLESYLRLDKIDELQKQLAESDSYIKECLNNDNAMIKHLETKLAEKEKESIEFAEWIFNNTASKFGSKLRNYWVGGLLHGEYDTKQLYEIFTNQLTTNK